MKTKNRNYIQGAGCDKCGTNDRAPQSRFCAQCEPSSNCALCAAPFPPVPTGGGASGYAVTSDGKRICYACADARQREELKDRSKPFVGYVSEDGKRITTWTGGKLMDVSQSWPCKLTRNSWVHSANSYKCIRARDCHGALWYGRGSAGIAIVLRPMKSK